MINAVAFCFPGDIIDVLEILSEKNDDLVIFICPLICIEYVGFLLLTSYAYIQIIIYIIASINTVLRRNRPIFVNFMCFDLSDATVILNRQQL